MEAVLGSAISLAMIEVVINLRLFNQELIKLTR